MMKVAARLKHALRIGEFHQNRWEKELFWASVYHDTIRQLPFLQNLSVSPGRMAANYSMLYVLVRILRDAQPDSILEFGLGQSSLIINRCIITGGINASYTIVDDDENWIRAFRSFQDVSGDIHLAVKKYTRAFGRDIQTLQLPEVIADKPYQLIVVDGPRGISRYSRFTICEMAEKWDEGTECIVLLDDYDRWGERETGQALIEICRKKGMQVTHRVFNGLSDQLLLFTPAFEICRSF